MMTLKKRTSLFLVPFALCAIGIGAFVFAGCSREEPKSSPEKAAPSGSVGDPAFLGELKKLRVERQKLAATRQQLVEQMKAKVDAAKARLKTDDEKLVKAELEKDPEWRSLYDRCVDANTAIDEQRRKAGDVVREKIASKKVRGVDSVTSGEDTASPLKKVPMVAEKISK